VIFDPPGGPLAAERLTPPTTWWEVDYPEAREQIIYHGPALRRITGCWLSERESWMRIAAESLAALAGRRGPDGWILAPAVHDACLFGCGLHVWLDSPAMVAIPLAIRRLRFARQPRPGETCYQRLVPVSRSADRAVFDFALAGEDGDVILTAAGFEAIVLKGGDAP
jgi:hypothetical protein